MKTCERCGDKFGLNEGRYNTPYGLFCVDCWTGRYKATKALTIKNPFALLVAIGHKTIEVRSKPTKFRGTIYVHASKQSSKLELFLPGSLAHTTAIDTLGKVVATVDIIDCRPLAETDKAACCLANMPHGHYAWVLANAKPIKPFELKGQLGLFNVNI